ncbi:MAG: hypothetical protein HC767_07705 [Akkermansiaceae bacterium]|nr:hypothetical protein [Akkermansiaceae bacterium]
MLSLPSGDLDELVEHFGGRLQNKEGASSARISAPRTAFVDVGDAAH